MDFDITTIRRTLTPYRNREKNPATRQQLTNLLNTAEGWNREPDPVRRTELRKSFKDQWTKFEEHVRGAE